MRVQLITLFFGAILATAAWLQLLSAKWGAGAIFLVVAAIIWQFRHQAASILCVFVGVLFVGALAGTPQLKVWDDPAGRHELDGRAETWARSGPFNSDLPIVLHLVFDELMSSGALPDEIHGSEEIRARSYRLAREAGFRVYDSVFARNFFSAVSLPNVFGPEYLGHDGADDILREEKVDVRDNAYFAELQRQGYRTAVFQTAHVNFCADESVDLCETFDSFDPATSGDYPKDMRTRVIDLAHTLLRAYEPSHASALGALVLSKVSSLRLGSPGVLGVAGRYDVQGFPWWFDRFSAFATAVPRGSHVFAHVLVPHSPYLLKSDCQIDGTWDSGYYLASRFEADVRGTKRDAYYAAYLEQLGCVYTKIEQLLSTLNQLDKYRDATIVIHGDHGSRISNGNILEDLETQDFVDNYGTFFAVRRPGVDAGVDCTFTSLGEVFRQHLAPAPAGRSGDEAPSVLVISRAASDAKVEVRMPTFGCASDAQ